MLDWSPLQIAACPRPQRCTCSVELQAGRRPPAPARAPHLAMALVAHYDLELHQRDVKTTFLNGDLKENVYMAQPKGFVMEGKERLGCHLKIHLWIKTSFKTVVLEV